MRYLLPVLFALPLAAQITQSPQDAKIQALSNAKDWAGLADFIESLSPKERGRFLIPWMSSLHRASRFERALHVAEAVLSQLPNLKDPQAIAALEFKARSLSSLNRNAEAALTWEQLGLQAGRPSQLENAVVEARNGRDWDTMARVARKYGELNPGMKALADGWLGEALARQEHFQEAEPVLRAALLAQPKQPFAWSNLARCLNEKKAYAEAQEACTQALALDPSLMEAFYNRGRAAFELKRFPQAVEDFRAALVLLPEDPVLKENLRQAQRYANPGGALRKTR